MHLRIAVPARCGPRLLLAIGLLALSPLGIDAQELRLERDYPGSGPYQCLPPEHSDPPDAAQLAQAAQLATAADEALVLGQLERSAELYTRAVEADPTDADFAFRHADVLEQLDRLDDALAEYCRASHLDTQEAGLSDEEIRERMDSLYAEIRARFPASARDAFVAGLAHADSAMYEEARGDFTDAMDEMPNWGAPIYNRAIVHEELGMIAEAIADYRLYIQTAPTAIDPVVLAVTERIAIIETVAAGAPSPVGALVLGLVPGMGHYYTNRPIAGTIVLAVAGTALATGLLTKDVAVYCFDTNCPPDEVLDEVSERPYLGAAIGVSAAVTIVGAVEAFVRARRRRAEAEALTSRTSASSVGLRLEAPSLASRGGRLDVRLLHLRFR